MADEQPTPPADWRVKYGPLAYKIGVYVLTAFLGALATWLGVSPKIVEVVKEIPVQVAGSEAAAPPGELAVATGWTPDADASAADAKATQFRTFADTPAGLVAASDLPKEVFGWKYVEKLTGKPTPLEDQNPTGACVGFGSAAVVERTLAADIVARNGSPAEFAFFSREVMYAGPKVQGARAMGASVSREDGSAGVFCKAYFAAGYGMVPKKKYPTIDLSTYDPARARSWNTSGPPAEVLAESKKFPVKDAVKVTNWQQAKQAMASGYFPSVCASWRASGERDANGVAKDLTNGSRDDWNHCMGLDGYIVLDDGREFGHIENSWSNLPDKFGRRTGRSFHTGPVGWGNPTTAGFWWPAASIDRALRQGDTYAYSGVTGFPARKLVWFILHPRKNDIPNVREVASLAW